LVDAAQLVSYHKISRKTKLKLRGLISRTLGPFPSGISKPKFGELYV
jgi:hypothetical protein